MLMPRENPHKRLASSELPSHPKRLEVSRFSSPNDLRQETNQQVRAQQFSGSAERQDPSSPLAQQEELGRYPESPLAPDRFFGQSSLWSGIEHGNDPLETRSWLTQALAGEELAVPLPSGAFESREENLYFLLDSNHSSLQGSSTQFLHFASPSAFISPENNERVVAENGKEGGEEQGQWGGRSDGGEVERGRARTRQEPKQRVRLRSQERVGEDGQRVGGGTE